MELSWVRFDWIGFEFCYLIQWLIQEYHCTNIRHSYYWSFDRNWRIKFWIIRWETKYFTFGSLGSWFLSWIKFNTSRRPLGFFFLSVTEMSEFWRIRAHVSGKPENSPVSGSNPTWTWCSKPDGDDITGRYSLDGWFVVLGRIYEITEK